MTELNRTLIIFAIMIVCDMIGFLLMMNYDTLKIGAIIILSGCWLFFINVLFTKYFNK